MCDITKEFLRELFYYRNGFLYYKVRPCWSSVDISKPAGATRKDGYRRVGLCGHRFLVHRLIFIFHHGYLPGEIDHINNIKDDNRIENLREASRVNNNCNKTLRNDSTSGYKGVTLHRATKRYQARIRSDGKRKSLGYFDCANDAHAAYCKAARELHGEFSNFG